MYILVKNNVIVAEDNTVSKLLVNYFKIRVEKPDSNKIIGLVNELELVQYRRSAWSEVEVIHDLVLHVKTKLLKEWGFKIYKEV